MAAIIHKVRRGETLMSICLVYGLDFERLVWLNAKFLGMDYRYDEASVGDYVVVGDSADPIDLVRVLSRRGKI